MNDQAIGIIGAGAFGTALAIVLARAGRRVVLWGRNPNAIADMMRERQNSTALPGAEFPAALEPTNDISIAMNCPVVLLAVPTQSLRHVIQDACTTTPDAILIACCKGIEVNTGLLPTEVVTSIFPSAHTGVITGPSFATDIASGKPTALTFATNHVWAEKFQALLSTPTLRLYLSTDPIGAQLGGALKNVVAIPAGIVIGAGLGESARSALMTRGFAEMNRYAQNRGAQRDTLFGLSGFGDLILTCTSTQSRNMRHGLAIGAQLPTEPTVTVEGIMTAHAISKYDHGVDMPITQMVSAVLSQKLTLDQAIAILLARPLKHEGQA